MSKPAIKVDVSTDNMNTVTLSVEKRERGQKGVRRALVVAAAGNAYQGLHQLREGLESTIADLLDGGGDPELWATVEPPAEELEAIAVEQAAAAEARKSKAPKGKAADE